jgi:hypothetical protein
MEVRESGGSHNALIIAPGEGEGKMQ